MAIFRSFVLTRRLVGYAAAALLGLAGAVAVAAPSTAAPVATPLVSAPLVSTPSPQESPALAAPIAPVPAPDCHASVIITAQWATGFTANVTLTNIGSTTWQFWRATIIMPPGYRIVSIWNVGVTSVGSTIVVYGPGPVAPGASVTFGFVAAGTGPIGPIQVICDGF
ncbi:MAG TPA: cellulose binding domain-containing protein [Micromonosporaceae bacterium]|nr:cellulose binding domain-containing protein [Micromonosporaceae bacterium]